MTSLAANLRGVRGSEVPQSPSSEAPPAQPVAARPLRIWFDMTASAHPVVLRPVIERLREAGHEVEITAREYAQTVGLLDLHGLDHTVVGRHAGASRSRKLLALFSRTQRLHRWADSRFDLAVGHGSNDLALAAAWAGIPAVNMFDYEFAIQQHHIGCRLAKRVITPDAIPPSRLARFGAVPPKLVQYPGLKEEYYLADFKPDPEILPRLGVDGSRVVIVVRPPPDVSLYHRKANPLFLRVLEYVGQRDDVQAVVLPRTDAQRAQVRSLELPSVVVMPGAVDAQSLIAASDLVVSAGGSMNREAVALGVPVYTTYGGRLGGVDETLIRTGRLRPLTDPRGLEFHKRTSTSEWMRRDPGRLVEMILSTLS
jgi:predicted glycosyltransferase